MADRLACGRIVVGVDGSAASAAAVRWAVREARLREAAVHLLYVYYDDAGMRAPYAPWSCMTAGGEGRATARATLTDAVKAARRDLPPWQVTAELADGLPVRAMLDRAADAEMLVLGTSRPVTQPGQPPLAMGPVARDCLRLASCPVVVVNAAREPISHEQLTGEVHRRPFGSHDGPCRQDLTPSRPDVAVPAAPPARS
ncbi:MAG: universal stress protein [Streptosporangiaceae bacterium]